MIHAENVTFGVRDDRSLSVKFSNILVVRGRISEREYMFRGTDEPISGYAVHGGDSPEYNASSFSVDDALAYYGEDIVMLEPEISLEMALDAGIAFGSDVYRREDGIVRFFGKSGGSCACKMTYHASNTIQFSLIY